MKRPVQGDRARSSSPWRRSRSSARSPAPRASPSSKARSWQAGSCNSAAGWQAGTCTIDPCSRNAELFFTQAAGHPPNGFTQIHRPTRTGGCPEEPVGKLKTSWSICHAGLSVNPQATAPVRAGVEGASPADLPARPIVGQQPVRCHSLTSLGLPVPSRSRSTTSSPTTGEPALFGFNVSVLLVNGRLPQRRRRLGERLPRGLHDPRSPELGPGRLADPAKPPGLRRATEPPGGGRFLTMPSTCSNPVDTASSPVHDLPPRRLVERRSADDSYDVAAPAPPATSSLVRKKCGAAAARRRARSAAPSPSAATRSTRAPTRPTPRPAPTVKVDGPVRSPTRRSTTRTSSAPRVTLPQGMGVNPSAAPRPGRLHRRPVRQGDAGTPVACPADRRSAPSRSTPRRCPTAP